MSRVAVPIASVALAACVQFAWAPASLAGTHDALIAKYSAENGVPEPLVRRVIKQESGGRADVVHRGNYGLMQIRLGTARALGYSGDAHGLLDPDTNLTYAVRYLAGAYRAAGCDTQRAISYYRRGYHGVKHGRCGTPEIAVAEADIDSKPGAAKRKSDATSAPAIDVIKPRVVQTELISKSKPDAVPTPRLAKFEPVRMATIAAVHVPLPSPKPAALIKKQELALSTVGATPDGQSADAAPLPKAASQPAAATSALTEVASLSTDSAADVVPLPRARPQHPHEGKPAHHAKHMRAVDPGPVHAAKKDDDSLDVSGAVTSFFKKLTTVDKKPRQQAARQSPRDPASPQNY